MALTNLEALEQPITARLATISDEGITVRWLPNQRGQMGERATGDSVTLAWASSAVLRTSATRGSMTVTHTLVAYLKASNVRGDGGLYWIRNELKQRIVGHQFPDVGFLDFAGEAMTEPEERDPSYRMAVRFTCTVNESIDRHA